MCCPHCESTATKEQCKRTELGYRRFRCCTCQREFNERTGTCFNHLQYPTDIVCLGVRYKLSLRDLSEMFLERGLVSTYEAVRAWEAHLTPLLSEAQAPTRTNRAELVYGRDLQILLANVERRLYAASAAKWETRVCARGRSTNHAARRSRFMAAAVATCCKCVFSRPI